MDVVRRVFEVGDVVVGSRLSVLVAGDVRAPSGSVVAVAAADSVEDAGVESPADRDTDAVGDESPADPDTDAVKVESLSNSGRGPL